MAQNQIHILCTKGCGINIDILAFFAAISNYSQVRVTLLNVFCSLTKDIPSSEDNELVPLVL